MNKIIVLISLLASVRAQSNKTRWQILEDEMKMSVGGNLTLEKGIYNETLVNNTLMGWKLEELDYAYENPRYFNFSRSYFEYREYMEASPVYQFIKAMPKGALLHVHANAIVSSDYWVSNITYREGLFICQEEKIKFKFSNAVPKDPCKKSWKLMKDVRKAAKSVKEFDQELKKSFTLVGSDNYKSNDEVWKRFLDIFDIIWPLWSYRPVWEDYVYETLRTLKDDKVMYVEMRSSVPPIHELDGSEHDAIFFVNTTKSVVDRFVRDFPEFFGAKLICSFNRHGYKLAKDVVASLNLTQTLKKLFPHFIAGFDLVSHEDKGNALLRFLPHLEAARTELDYFFHAGETNWYGMQSDQNLVDAVLLGSKRIGHANALMKHPAVLAEMVRRGVGMEVNVVSNSVLGLGSDVRLHPLSSWLASGLPVTLSSDDPGLWDAAPLSTDFYVTFIGVASYHHDLRLLKQLALNSLKYSALSPEEKEAAFKLFDKQWREFILNGTKTDFKAKANEAKKKIFDRKARLEPVGSNTSNLGGFSHIKLLILFSFIAILSR